MITRRLANLARRGARMSLFPSIGLMMFACSAAPPTAPAEQDSIESASEALTSPCGNIPKASVCNREQCTGDGWLQVALAKGTACTSSTGAAGRCDGGNPANETFGKCVPSITGKLDPNYYLLTILYAPPGASSTVDYGTGQTFSTSTSLTSTWSDESKITASVSNNIPLVGSGGLSITTTASASLGTKDSTDVKSTTQTDFELAGLEDLVDHDVDRIYLMLNPQLNVTANGDDISWALGTRDGQNPSVVYVTPGWLKNPSTMEPTLAALLAQSNILPSDYPQILALDPFATGTTTFDPNRFVYQGEFPFEPPAAGQKQQPTKQSLMASSTSTHGTTGSTGYSVGVTIEGGVDFTKLMSLKMSSSNTVTYKSQSDNSVASGATISASASILQPPVGYDGPVELDVYLDTVFNSFVFAFRGSVGCDVAHLRQGDFNGDGKSDVFCDASDVTGQVSTWLANGDGTYAATQFANPSDPTPLSGNGLVAIDVSGDGQTDLVHLTPTGNVLTWLSNGDGTYKTVSYSTSSDTCLLNCGTWQFGDVNHDGKADLIHLTSNPGAVVTWLSNGNGTYNPVWYTTTVDTALQNGDGFMAIDVNGDGRSDLVHITTNPGNVITWLSNGNGAYTPVSFTTAADTCLINCGTWQFADVNHDAKIDLIHLTTNPGNVITWLSNGNGTYNPISFTTTTDSQLQNGKGLLAADVNGDGNADLVHLTANTGTVITWLSNGNGTYATSSYTSAIDGCLTNCGTWQFVDVNHDQKTDLIHIVGNQTMSWMAKGDGTYNVLPSALP